MPHTETEHRVRHAAEEMYALVADISRYPEFVPFCERLIVRATQETPTGSTLVADMTVGYGAIRETFTTRVSLEPAQRTINIQYLEGPFRHLDSRWEFIPDGPKACRVRFTIDYEFKSRILAIAMGAVFERMFGRFMAAFEARADAIYGAAAVGA